jgi:hypothetical protein
MLFFREPLNTAGTFREMREKKVLKGMKAFKEIYFVTCYYQALFPIISYFKKSISPFVWNYAFMYGYNRKDTKVPFELKAVPKYRVDLLLSTLGIGLECIPSTDRIIEDLIISIEQSKPVIINIDIYYESLNLRAYKKRHWPHMITVYGYDNPGRFFHVIEYGYPYRVSTERTMDYTEVVNAYKGYLENYDKPGTAPTLQKYFRLNNGQVPGQDYNDPLYKKIFISQLKRNRNLILHGLEYIKRFAVDFKTVFFSEANFKAYAHELHRCLIRVIRHKSSEGYAILRLFPAMSNHMDVFNQSINNWKLVYAITRKLGISLKYNSKSVELAIGKINEIYENDSRFYKTLFERI